MALSRLHPAFQLLLCLHAALAYVEPPTNVTLHCHNLQNILRWSYSPFSPGLKFKVKIFRYEGDKEDHWVEPPRLEADLSFLNEPNNQYLLQLVAVMGNEESANVPADGIVFSYLKDSLVTQKCFLDLPPVNVTVQEDAMVQFRFSHPWLTYRHKLPSSRNSKRRNKKSHDSLRDKPLPDFKYDVVINDQEPHELTCVEKVCEGSLPVNASQEQHCVSITGELEKMIVQTTESYCAQPIKVVVEPNNLVLIYCLVASVATAAIICIMIYLRKTRASGSLPNTIKRIHSIAHQSQTLRTENVVPSRLDIEPTSPTPLLQTPEEGTDDTQVFIRPDNDGHLPIRGVKGGEEEEEEETERDASEEVGQPSENAYPYAGGLTLEDDAPSGYEKREKLNVALGPGDHAEGYRGNVA